MSDQPPTGGTSIDYRERFIDPVETLRFVFEALQAGLWTALPASVVSYNAAAQTIVAQPSIKGMRRMPNGTVVLQNLPVCPDVPCVFPQGGNVALTFPIAAGDECLLVFACRCIDNWIQSGGIQPQFEQRLHDLSDGFAIMGIRSQPRKLANVSTTTAQLRTVDGTTYAEIDPVHNNFNVVATGTISLNAPSVTINGTTLEITNLPTSDPGGSDRIWRPSGPGPSEIDITAGP